MNQDCDLLSREDMLALIESGRELAAEVSLRALLQKILGRASALTDSPDTSVILRHDDRDGLYVAAATGDKADWVLTTFGRDSAKAIPVDGSKAGYVFTTGKSLVEGAIEGHFKGVDAETKKATQSMVCVPLSVGEKRLGVMQILNKRTGEFNDHDRVVLEHFASQAAVAIQNAQWVESLLAHSGLYTRLTADSQPSDLMRAIHQPAHAETLTVLFADMRGFTQFCQMLPPAELQSHVNGFLTMLAEEVIDHDGMVNKFLGDGVMAVFRGEDHARHAVDAAFDIVDRFHKLRQQWNDESSQALDFLDIGIGIVTDQVTIGAMGSEKVRDFTVIGSGVNLAAAFEREARDGARIVVNHHTYRQVKDFVLADKPENFAFKGADQSHGFTYKRYTLRKRVEAKEQMVFLSHSHLDRELVERQVVKPLQEQGVRTWFSSVDIPKGALWPAEIRKALSRCAWMVVVVSKNSGGSEWVRLEVDMAVGLGHLRGKVIPLQIDDTPPGKVNEYLVSMQAIDIGQTPDFVGSLVELIQSNKGDEITSPA